MSLITNYGQLKAAILDHLMDAELGGNEDRACKNGHDMLMRELRWLVDMTFDADITLDSDDITLSFNPKTIISFYLDTQEKSRLYERTSRQIDEINNSHSTKELENYPYYARQGNKLRFPSFQGARNAKMRYKTNFEFFTDDTDTNWLLDNYPGAYEFASLYYAAQFISDQEKMAEAQTYANQIIESIRDENRDRRHLNDGALSPSSTARYTP